MGDTLIVLPTYNEIENLERIVGRIRQAAPQADLLIVDDSSPDGTGRLADTLANDDPGVEVLHRTSKDGLGAAYLAGFDVAATRGHTFVVEIDADGSHDPAELPAMIELARSGADLVIGSRWIPGGEVRNWPWLRQVISRSGNLYSRVALGSSVSDLTSGFRVMRTSVLTAVIPGSVSSQGYCFQVELAWRFERAGAVIVEHPIIFAERTQGQSKMHAGIVAEAFWRVTGWALTRRIPRRIRDRGSVR